MKKFLKNKNNFRYNFLIILSVFFILLIISIFLNSYVYLLDTEIIKSNYWKRQVVNERNVSNMLDKLENKKYALVFGTSKSQRISKKQLGVSTLNFQYLYGDPKVVLNFLEKLETKHWNNIISIHFLLDFHIFNDDKYSRDLSKIFKEKYYFWQDVKNIWISLSVENLYTSIFRIFKNLSKGYEYFIHNDGHLIAVKERIYKGIITDDRLCNLPENDYIFNINKLNYISEIEKLVHSKKINIYFFSPLITTGLAKSHLPFLNDYVNGIVNNISNFYLFIYIDNISSNRFNFADQSHLSNSGIDNLFLLDWNNYKINKNNKSVKTNSLINNINKSNSLKERVNCK